MILNGHPTIAASAQERVSPQARQLKKLTAFPQPGSKFSKTQLTRLSWRLTQRSLLRPKARAVCRR
ncbi:unnamed protein product, partial [Rangifer tarandus platyrhynchus]